MRKKHLTLFLFFSLLLLIQFVYSGCTVCSEKKITCSGYNDSFVSEWFPYMRDDKIIFSNPANDKDSITIKESIKSEPTEITIGGYGNNRHCNASYIVTSLELDSTYQPRMEVYSSINFSNSGDVQGKNTQLILFGQKFETNNITDTGFVSINAPYIYTKYFSSITLKNKIFTNVQLIKIDTSATKPNKIMSLYISKNVGIVGYVNYPSGEQWIKK